MSDSITDSGRLNLDSIVEIVYKPLGEKGEDAFAYSFEKPAFHTQAVFDGCGGAGSWQYAEFKNATGAFISAQSIAREYLSWFNSLSPSCSEDIDSIGKLFHDMTLAVLSELKNSCAPMKVSGSLVKSFPCTASAALITRRDNGISLTTLNVGDSRVYFLTPKTGLVQITVDDSQGNPDPMESLRNSAPLSDMLNADNPYSVKTRHVNLPTPCAVICATDGVFGFLRSPMDFEFLILDTLMHSGSFAQYEKMLKEQIVKVAGDDSTCIMSFYGWGAFDSVREKLRSRHHYLEKIIRSIDAQNKSDSFDTELEKIWESYRSQTLLDEIQG